MYIWDYDSKGRQNLVGQEQFVLFYTKNRIPTTKKNEAKSIVKKVKQKMNQQIIAVDDYLNKITNFGFEYAPKLIGGLP
jgi:outer membrane lipoprotein-sorting protein